MRRVPEVLDCWFESGSMPFAQVHYPFENREWFENHYPGDFIVEYIGADARLVLHAARAGHGAVRPAGVPNCVVPRHRARRRRPQDVQEAAQLPRRRTRCSTRYGADALRWFLMASPILRGGDLSSTEAGDPRGRAPGAAADVERLLLLLAVRERRRRTRRVARTDSPHVLDRYVLAKTARAGRGRHRALDAYDISRRVRAVATFLDALTNWYIRRSATASGPATRTRSTRCYTVLETVAPRVAPLLPLMTEEVYRGLTGGRSVHLADWPDAGDAARPTTRWWRRWTRARGLLGGAVAAQGARAAGAAAAGRAAVADGRRRRLCAPSPTSSPTRST